MTSPSGGSTCRVTSRRQVHLRPVGSGTSASISAGKRLQLHPLRNVEKSATGYEDGETGSMADTGPSADDYLTPEARARVAIDRMLVAAGWAVQSYSLVNLTAAKGVAV